MNRESRRNLVTEGWRRYQKQSHQCNSLLQHLSLQKASCLAKLMVCSDMELPSVKSSKPWRVSFHASIKAPSAPSWGAVLMRTQSLFPAYDSILLYPSISLLQTSQTALKTRFLSVVLITITTSPNCLERKNKCQYLHKTCRRFEFLLFIHALR